MNRKGPKQHRAGRYDPLAVLAYIVTYQERNKQRSPSQRQIQAALNISVPSVVHNIVHRLERRALLTITRYGHGVGVDLALTEAGQEAVRRWQSERARRESG